MHGYLFTLVGIIMVILSFTTFKEDATIKYSLLASSFFLFVLGSFIKFKALVKLKKEMDEKVLAAKQKKEKENS